VFKELKKVTALSSRIGRAITAF